MTRMRRFLNKVRPPAVGLLCGIVLLAAFAWIQYGPASSYLQSHAKQRQKENYLALMRNHPYNNRPAFTAEELRAMPKADRPDLAMEQDFLRTLDPALGYPPRERLLPIFEQVQEFKRQNALRKVPGQASNPWIERGPANVGGRTRALMYDPNDAPNYKKVWAGGVSGGLWYTTDVTNASLDWSKVDDFMDNLAISTLAYDPNSTQTFYMGTGEGWFNFDQVRGAGIWKSTNGGTDWSQLTSTTGSDFHYVQKVVVHPSTSDVYAATRSALTSLTGIMRSTDGGASWTRVLGSGAGSSSSRGADIEIAADGTNFASMGIFSTDGIYSSSSGAAGSWTKLNTGSNGFPTTDIRRIEIATAPTDADVVYAAVQNGGVAIKGLYRSDDQGSTWTTLALPDDADLGIPASDFTRGQAFYDLIMAVDPTDKTNVVVGAINLFRSTDSGTSWSQISKWSNNPDMDTLPVSLVHADHHALVFKPGSSSELINGNDGGVYRTTSLGTAASADVFTAIESGYNTTQFYACAIHPTAATNHFLGGTQDNGTQRLDQAGLNTAATEVSGGDGGFCHIDQTDATFQFSSTPNNNIYRSTNGGTSFSYLSSVSDASGSFINPSDYDNNLDILYSGASSTQINRISGLTSSPSLTKLTIAGLSDDVTHVRVSEYTTGSTTLFIGTADAEIIKVTNADGGSPSATNIEDVGMPAGGSVSCIELGADEDELLVTFFNFGVTSVWYTDDGGSSWVSKEGDLPDMPVRWALFNPNDRDEVILATELGVWSTLDFSAASPSWTPSNSGLANVRVDMLQMRDSDYEVIAGTHGRGMFSSNGFTRLILTESGGSTDVTEGGATDTYEISLNFTPTSDVTITATPDAQLDLGAGAGVAINLTFNTTTPQTVTVTAVDDAAFEGTHTGTITHSSSSSDTQFDGLTIPDVVANITDNDPISKNKIGPGYAMDFDGSDDYVSVPHFNKPSAFTVEAWIKKSVAGFDAIVSWGASTSDYALLGDFGDGRIAYCQNDGSGSCFVGSSITTGEWTHVAVVDDGTASGNIRIYVNGVLDVGPGTFTKTPTSDSLGIGATPRNGSTDHEFEGQIDEVRIWSVVRTEAQIRDTMCEKLTGTESGLEAYFRLDETASTTADEISSNDRDGTMTNMDPSTDRILSGAHIGDDSADDYSGSSSDVTLAHADGDFLRAFITGGSPDGVHIYRVDEAPNVTTPPGSYSLLDLTRYWGVFVPGGGIYTVVYNYGARTDIVDDSQLRFASRADNTGTSWTDIGAILDVGSTTLTKTGQTGTEYILGAENNFLVPVELMAFTATYGGGAITLSWSTASETENLGFYVYRSETADGEYVQMNEELIPGAGSSADRHDYSWIDHNFEPEKTYYYKLADVDLRGNYEFHGPVSVTTAAVPTEYRLAQNFPNPFNPTTTINFDLPEANEVELMIYDMTGKLVRRLVSKQMEAGRHGLIWDATNDAGIHVASGVYMYRLRAGAFTAKKKVVLVR